MGSIMRVLGLVLISVLVSCWSSEAHRFIVGGKDGWVSNTPQNFNQWAESQRFLVNDTLYFKYKTGSDSVLVVTKDDYKSCNTKAPNVSLTNGDSIFKFERSGPFYFISGNAENCQKGQKLIVVVLAVRNNQPPPPSPSAPSPSPLYVSRDPAPSDLDANAPAQHPRDNLAAGSRVGFMGLICTVTMTIGVSVVVLGNFVV